MNNDELQILGAEKPKKKNKVVITIISLVVLLAIGGIYYALSSKQPDARSSNSDGGADR